jgi:hypothetical protein
MNVGRLLPIALLVLVMTVATNARAEVLTTKGGELFCRDRSNFPEYLAVIHNKQASYHTVEGCRQPAKGTRYEVVKDSVETGIARYTFTSGRGRSRAICWFRAISDPEAGIRPRLLSD